MFKTSVSAVKPLPTDPGNCISQIGKMYRLAIYSTKLLTTVLLSVILFNGFVDNRFVE